MRSQLVVLSTILSFLARLGRVASLVGLDMDFAAPLEDSSVFLLSETPEESNGFDLFLDSSTNQPTIPEFDQATSILTGETTLTEYLLPHPGSDDEFLEPNFLQLAGSCSGSVNPHANQGIISKSRIKRLDVASDYCDDKPGSHGGVDDLDLSKVDPESADLLGLFRAERGEDFSRAMRNGQQNTFCYMLTAGILPWGVCYGGWAGLDDMSVDNTPLQTSWAFWHTVTLSQVTYARGLMSVCDDDDFVYCCQNIAEVPGKGLQGQICVPLYVLMSSGLLPPIGLRMRG